MARRKVRPPGEIESPAPPRPEFASSFAGELSSDQEYADLTLAGVELPGDVLENVAVTRAVLERVRGTGAVLTGLSLTDVTLRACDFANARWDGVIIHRLEVIDSRLMGLHLAEGHVESALFRECAAPLAVFFQTEFAGVRFEKCNLAEADFRECDLRGAVFQACELRDADFRGARLQSADFRTSTLEGMKLAGVENVRGAIVDPFQAAYLAGQEELLGLSVRYD
jgi:uncharacterized protein YjbI with pentapeptide repeats